MNILENQRCSWSTVARFDRCAHGSEAPAPSRGTNRQFRQLPPREASRSTSCPCLGATGQQVTTKVSAVRPQPLGVLLQCRTPDAGFSSRSWRDHDCGSRRESFGSGRTVERRALSTSSKWLRGAGWSVAGAASRVRYRMGLNKVSGHTLRVRRVGHHDLPARGSSRIPLSWLYEHQHQQASSSCARTGLDAATCSHALQAARSRARRRPARARVPSALQDQLRQALPGRPR